MENVEKTTSTESKTTTEEKTLKPPIPNLIMLGLFLLGTLGIIYSGYVHGQMHLLTTLKNARDLYV